MTRQKNMNNKASEIAKTKFHELLKSGACPKVDYKSGDAPGYVSYNMIEYSTVWARFLKVAHNKLVELGYEYGFWENKRNKDYFKAVEESVKDITEDQLNPQLERFQTMWD